MELTKGPTEVAISRAPDTNTGAPSGLVSGIPSEVPSAALTDVPSEKLTELPTRTLTDMPGALRPIKADTPARPSPAAAPSEAPTVHLTERPTRLPTNMPTAVAFEGVGASSSPIEPPTRGPTAGPLSAEVEEEALRAAPPAGTAVGLIIGVVAGIAVLVALSMLMLWRCCRAKRMPVQAADAEAEPAVEPRWSRALEQPVLVESSPGHALVQTGVAGTSQVEATTVPAVLHRYRAPSP